MKKSEKKQMQQELINLDHSQQVGDIDRDYIQQQIQEGIHAESTGALFNQFCRRCHIPSGEDNILIRPCDCTGNMRMVHQRCLIDWIKQKQKEEIENPNFQIENLKCDICKSNFEIVYQKQRKQWTKNKIKKHYQKWVLLGVSFILMISMMLALVLYIVYFLLLKFEILYRGSRDLLTDERPNQSDLNVFYVILVLICFSFWMTILAFLYLLYILVFKKKVKIQSIKDRSENYQDPQTN